MRWIQLLPHLGDGIVVRGLLLRQHSQRHGPSILVAIRSAPIVIVTVIAILWSPAQAEVTACRGKIFAPAEGVTVLCSENWHFTGGVCKEQDLVYDWKIQGRTSPPGWNIPPWEERPITIRGIELTMVGDGEQAQRFANADARAKLPWWRRGAHWFSRDDEVRGNKTIWWMAGNSYVPDVMLFLGSNERHGRHIFPTGLGMPFPPAGTKGAYLDLHGSCCGGGAVSFFYTVYYSLP